MSALSSILSGVNRLRTGTTGVPVVYPSLAAAIAPTSGAGAWVLGAYSQIVAAGSIGTVSLVGVLVVPTASDSDSFQYEVAQGGAGSEVVVWRGAFRMRQASDVGYQNGHYVAVSPAVQLTTNARLAVRTASGGAGTISLAFWLVVMPRPF